MTKFVRHVEYEWTAEELNPSDLDEIVEVFFFETCAEALAFVGGQQNFDVGLARTVAETPPGSPFQNWREDPCTEMAEREYVYINDGTLPDEFDDGSVVPKRFHAELKKALLRDTKKD